MRKYVHLPHSIFGFEDVEDFIATLLGLNVKRILTWDILMITLGTITALLTTYIWQDTHQFIILMLLVLCDTLLGTRIAWVNKKFETNRFLRSLWILVYYIITLTVVHNFSKLSQEFSILSPLVFYWLAGKTFISVIKNLSLLGVPLPPYIEKLVMERVDAFKNEDKKDKVD